MGAWGVGIFSNDDATDVRDDFRDLLADGLGAQEATDRLAAEYVSGGADTDSNDFWLGLAATQHKVGHVDDRVTQRALAIIEDPNELDRWDSALRRRRAAALAKLKEQLSQPPPAPKRVRKRSKVDTKLQAGQHIVFDTGTRKVLLRVDRVNEDKGGRYPVVTLLRWKGSRRELRKAHRLPGVEEPTPSRRREWRGFTLIGEPLDPEGLRVLPCCADAQTPTDWSSGWVVRWSQLEDFFNPDGTPRSP